MRTRTFTFSRGAAALTFALTAMAAMPASAAVYWLKAAQFTMPDPNGGTPIPMWGYALCGANHTQCGVVSVPGPALTVAATDSTLDVYLLNALSVPTSMVINGLVKPMTPVWDDGTPSKTRPSATARVRSFDLEAAAQGPSQHYQWLNVKPGTYLYQSGTQPQVQVQMGLYGGLTKNAVEAAGSTRAQAYAGAAFGYDNQSTLLYSEIDPELHSAVATGRYGACGAGDPSPCPKVTSTFAYAPRYFLINGKPYQIGTPSIVPAGPAGTTLLRLLNAGLTTHVPMIEGNYWNVIAEDGKPYPYAKNQYTALMPAAKTLDVLLTRAPGVTHAILDRRLNLSNDGVSDGGMLVFLGTGGLAGGGVGGGGGGSGANAPPIGVADNYDSVPGAALSISAPGVLANDDPTDGPTLKAIASSGGTSRGGTYSLNANGSFTYSPPTTPPAVPYADTFTYLATDGAASSAATTVTINVATPSAPSFSGTLDNFGRADTASLGPDWSQTAATNSSPDVQISANVAKAVTSSLGGQAIWSKAPSQGIFGAKQGAAFRFGSIADQTALILKATGGNAQATPANFVRVRYEAGASELVVATLLGGSNTAVYVRQAGFHLNSAPSNRTLSAAVDAKGLVTVFLDGSYVGGVQLPDVGAWKGGGRIGVQLQTQDATVDDFQGGSL